MRKRTADNSHIEPRPTGEVKRAIQIATSDDVLTLMRDETSYLGRTPWDIVRMIAALIVPRCGVCDNQCSSGTRHSIIAANHTEREAPLCAIHNQCHICFTIVDTVADVRVMYVSTAQVDTDELTICLCLTCFTVDSLRR